MGETGDPEFAAGRRCDQVEGGTWVRLHKEERGSEGEEVSNEHFNGMDEISNRPSLPSQDHY